MNDWMNETQREITCMWKKKNFEYMKDRNERQKEKMSKRITASSEWKKEWRDKLKNEWIPVNVRINEWKLKKNLTLYTLRSVWILSILFFIHFLRCWQGEFVYQSKASFIGDHFLYSHDLNVWFRGDIVRRN